MLAGAEFGHDFQALAIHLNIISKIFLNLIKIIIAPLLFGTLVVGIAGHSNIRQVGRMGWKSILYFEIISTLALFIGLAAINLSKAGVGVTLPQAMAQGTLPEVPKQT
jgi:proton glutamate symport protein